MKTKHILLLLALSALAGCALLDRGYQFCYNGACIGKTQPLTNISIVIPHLHEQSKVGLGVLTEPRRAGDTAPYPNGGK